jgi:hypothetical protein
MPQFDAEEIRDALALVASSLRAEGVDARIYVVGGAAMALAYYDRDLTRDVDCVFGPEDAVKRAAAAVAAQRGYPPDWLNNAVQMYVPIHGERDVAMVLESGSVSVTVAGPRLMLAMKLHAARGRRDFRDIEVLLARCDVATRDDAISIFEEFYRDHELSDLALEVIQNHLGRSSA